MPHKHEGFQEFFRKSLNAKQQDIVMRGTGVMVVHAGAGSGKTRVITSRMTALILEHGCDPASLMALTFTNKAAREMKERMTCFLGSTTHLPFLGTFHAYCMRLLREYRHAIALPNFSLIDDDDQEKLVKALITRYAVKKVTPRVVLSTISRIKNSASTGDVVYDEITDPCIRDLAIHYEREKTTSQCLDFDDLLLEALRLFKNNRDIREAHQRRVRHILVDEFQDTNRIQHALLNEMTLGERRIFALDSLCVVGDEDQSIYSWRGALPETMLTLKTHFPHAEIFTLDQNYRSVQPILDVAHEVIKQNTQRLPKKLWSAKHGTDRIRLFTCSTDYQEAELVATVARHYQACKISLGTCAVLYRSHYQSRGIEEALVRSSVPYVIFGGIQFYDRQEIKDLLAYLKLLVNPFDRIACTRIINTPYRGLGDSFQEAFLSLWEQQPFLQWFEIAELMLAEPSLSPAKKAALQAFCALFEELVSTQTPRTALEKIISATGYVDYLKRTNKPEEYVERFDNVKELLAAARAREDQGTASIGGFLEEIALLQETRVRQNKEERDCVQLMTLHASKGLEFDTVIIIGLEEGTLPSGHALYSSETLEEERRLLYVGITRAQERILLTQARCRLIYGRTSEQIISRFLKDLSGDRRVQQIDITTLNGTNVAHLCRQWLQPAVPPPNTSATGESRASASSRKQGGWRLDQKVVHVRFGYGVIKDIETGGAASTNLSIEFEHGIKKINAQFVQSAD